MVLATDMLAGSTTVIVPSAQFATYSFAPVGEIASPVGSEPVLARASSTAGEPRRLRMRRTCCSLRRIT